MIKAKQIVKSGSLEQIIGISGLWTRLKPPEIISLPRQSNGEVVSKAGGIILINLIHEIDLS